MDETIYMTTRTLSYKNAAFNQKPIFGRTASLRIRLPLTAPDRLGRLRDQKQ